MKNILTLGKNNFGFVSLKGEFEAEGLTEIDIAREAIIAYKNNLDYLVKIGGCEAKGNIQFLQDIGVTSIVAPMVETEFAMTKYMEMISNNIFEHVGVTIETITAVQNIDKIIEAGSKLTEVTIGRTDLTSSYGGSSVESKDTLDMVKLVARKAKACGLHVTMGGSISKNTVETLLFDTELFELIDCVETRKVVMKVGDFIKQGALEASLSFELEILKTRESASREIQQASMKRIEALQKRL